MSVMIDDQQQIVALSHILNYHKSPFFNQDLVPNVQQNCLLVDIQAHKLLSCVENVQSLPHRVIYMYKN